MTALFALIKMWFTNRPLFLAICLFAMVIRLHEKEGQGRVPPVDRQKLNVAFWKKYDRDASGGWL